MIPKDKMKTDPTVCIHKPYDDKPYDDKPYEDKP